MKIKVLGLCGSLRKASVNRQLLEAAIAALEPDEATVGNLALPLYNGDLEIQEGLPEAVEMLQSQIAHADAVIITSPEYNKGISGVLKNALDWISRTKDNPWQSKPVTVLSAAAGRTGGETANFTTRHCLMPFQPHLIASPMICIADGANQFDAEGNLTNQRYVKAIAAQMTILREAISVR